MPYLKLTSRLRRVMEQVERYFGTAGYTPDLRFLEQYPGLCPLCGRTGGRIGLYAAYAIPQAGMIYVPYCVCADCTKQHFHENGFDDEHRERIEDTIAHLLNIDRSGHYSENVPEPCRETLFKMEDEVLAHGIPINPGWLQYHADYCLGCGQLITSEKHVGLAMVKNLRPGTIVAVPYLMCTSCFTEPEREHSRKAYDRILNFLNGKYTPGTEPLQVQH